MRTSTQLALVLPALASFLSCLPSWKRWCYSLKRRGLLLNVRSPTSPSLEVVVREGLGLRTEFYIPSA